MSFQISEEAIKATTECPTNFYCLKNGGEPMHSEGRPVCEGVYLINNKFLRVTPYNNETCSYKLSYADEHACSCPVRIELYKKYNT